MSATVISVSIPETLLEKLNRFCNQEERSKSYCVKKGLEIYLEFEDEKAKIYNSKKAAIQALKPQKKATKSHA